MLAGMEHLPFDVDLQPVSLHINRAASVTGTQDVRAGPIDDPVFAGQLTRSFARDVASYRQQPVAVEVALARTFTMMPSFWSHASMRSATAGASGKLTSTSTMVKECSLMVRQRPMICGSTLRCSRRTFSRAASCVWAVERKVSMSPLRNSTSVLPDTEAPR